jgi:hypothetical protein
MLLELTAKGGRMNIGRRRRTVYIEPIEEPVTAPIEEPSPAIEPQRPDPAETQPQPVPDR